MTGVHDLGLFILAGVLLNLTPGVDFLYVLGRSAARGFASGVWAALGIGAGCFVHITAAALGLSAILASSAAAFTVVKWIGAAYLVYVGIGMIRQHPLEPVCGMVFGDPGTAAGCGLPCGSLAQPGPRRDVHRTGRKTCADRARLRRAEACDGDT